MKHRAPNATSLAVYFFLFTPISGSHAGWQVVHVVGALCNA
jgi:hypothetical protein